MTCSDSSSSIKIVPSPGSGGTGLGEPEASSSGASSGPPSPVDARVLRDLEVIKAGHDLYTVMTEGLLDAIRERYSIPTKYGLHVPLKDVFLTCGSGYRPDGSRRSSWNTEGAGGKTLATCSAAPTQGVGEAPPTKAPRSSSKRSSDASIPSDDPARRHKKVKVLSRRHKSRHGEGGSRSHSKGKEPTAYVEEPEGHAKSPDEAGTLVFVCPRSMKDLCRMKVHKDDVGYYALYMSDLAQQDPDKEMRARWENLRNSSKVWRDHAATEEFERGLLHPQLARELYTLSSEVLLARATKEMVLINNLLQDFDALKAGGGPEAVAAAEERVAELERTQQEQTEALQRLDTARKADDDLLKSVKDLESVRAELPKQAIDDYKGSIDFKEGLKRMGRVAYEYDYWVALARFRSSHPDSEVEEDPFTIKPEDDSVPMERQQAFDDSNPPES
ncbi:hypothetical protein BHE74_00004977 [Ensete ventricosum]|uniref:Uncharacterized protein n=1 Tax=Ensete ventricosum TaxID=4639 RepID=A0A445MI91_ENSVE|nr:hypothetical protein BHE74_00004977 [Ensete ventricosum]RZR73992.1 hypothetical protein BHM03_00030444 [Ensete ventricosum]